MKRKVLRPGNSKIAIAYIRESTEDQRLSPEVQKGRILDWAAREGLVVADWFIDHDVSGRLPVAKRPELVKALAALRVHGAGLLVAMKRCRLGRDVGEVAAIEALGRKEGATVRTADGGSDATGAAGTLSKGVQDVVNAYEAEIISERTTAALAVKKAKGERTGAVPYGMGLDVDGIRLVPCEAEQAVIASIRASRVAGVSLRAIVAQLAARGVVSRVGKPLALTQVARIAA